MKILKTLFLGIVSVSISSTVNATIFTVNNNAISPGQYTSLQAAIDASSAGDSVNVSGSNTSYGSIVIRKQLTLLGTGSYSQPLARILRV